MLAWPDTSEAVDAELGADAHVKMDPCGRSICCRRKRQFAFLLASAGCQNRSDAAADLSKSLEFNDCIDLYLDEDDKRQAAPMLMALIIIGADVASGTAAQLCHRWQRTQGSGPRWS